MVDSLHKLLVAAQPTVLHRLRNDTTNLNAHKSEFMNEPL